MPVGGVARCAILEQLLGSSYYLGSVFGKSVRRCMRDGCRTACARCSCAEVFARIAI